MDKLNPNFHDVTAAVCAAIGLLCPKAEDDAIELLYKLQLDIVGAYLRYRETAAPTANSLNVRHQQVMFFHLLAEVRLAMDELSEGEHIPEESHEHVQLLFGNLFEAAVYSTPADCGMVEAAVRAFMESVPELTDELEVVHAIGTFEFEAAEPTK